MSKLLYISPEFQQERNADSVCIGEFSGAQSVNLVCRQKALHNSSVLKRKASPRTLAHVDDVEFEWLGEDDVFINYTPIIPLGSTVDPWEDV